MSDDSIKAALEAMEIKKARLLKQAEADIERAMAAERAELEVVQRYLEKNNLRLVGANSAAPEPPKEPVVIRPAEAPKPVVLTITELAERYFSDPRSPVHGLRYKVRETYESLTRRVVSDIGHVRLADINPEDIRKWHENWSSDGKLAQAHGLVTKLRGIFSFGTTELNDPGCQRLSAIMNRMRFENPKPRSEALTGSQVDAIRAKAHQMGKPSIALAQALQFELMLTQKDVIGEWVPVTEPGGESDIVFEGSKWLHGLRWSEIDENWILRHVTSFRKKSVVIDLKPAVRVMEEIGKIGKRPTSDALIVSEYRHRYQLPWSAAEYRRWWRKIADAAGVPKNIKNMDSRPLESRSITTRDAIAAATPQQRLLIN